MSAEGRASMKKARPPAEAGDSRDAAHVRPGCGSDLPLSLREARERERAVVDDFGEASQMWGSTNSVNCRDRCAVELVRLATARRATDLALVAAVLRWVIAEYKLDAEVGPVDPSSVLDAIEEGK